eukprot:4117305-Alexandrium_andersonii.AAC.1
MLRVWNWSSEEVMHGSLPNLGTQALSRATNLDRLGFTWGIGNRRRLRRPGTKVGVQGALPPKT